MAAPAPAAGGITQHDLDMTEEELGAMYDAYARGEIPRYKDHLSDDNFFEDLEKVPLFMTKSPDEVNADEAPALAALQSIIYEDSTAENRANYHREVGNAEFKKGKAHYKTAIKCYTEGLKENCGVPAVEATLYANRAMVQLTMGNFRSCVEDCKEARKRDPKAIKVYYRAAKALAATEHFADALAWCDDGLAVDPSNADIQQLRANVLKSKAAKEKKERAVEAQKRKEKQAADTLDNAIRARGISLVSGGGASGEMRGVVHNPTGTTVTVDGEGALHWPVCFLYPESGQSDFVADWHENVTVDAQLNAVIGTPPPWDESGQYASANCDVFFEYFPPGKDDSVLVPIDRTRTLREVLSDKRCVVRERLPTLLVVPKGSSFREKLKFAPK